MAFPASSPAGMTGTENAGMEVASPSCAENLCNDWVNRLLKNAVIRQPVYGAGKHRYFQ